MLKSSSYLNEVVSLTVMLLMIIALVAGQADAKSQGQARTDAAAIEADRVDALDLPFHTTIKAHINGHPLTISIDAEAELRPVDIDDE